MQGPYGYQPTSLISLNGLPCLNKVLPYLTKISIENYEDTGEPPMPPHPTPPWVKSFNGDALYPELFEKTAGELSLGEGGGGGVPYKRGGNTHHFSQGCKSGCKSRVAGKEITNAVLMCCWSRLIRYEIFPENVFKTVSFTEVLVARWYLSGVKKKLEPRPDWSPCGF